MEVRTEAELLPSDCDIHPEVADALAQHDEIVRLARQWGAIGCAAYAKQPERTVRFEWTEYGVTRLRRKLKSARVPLTPEAMGPYAIAVMKVAATEVTAYYGTNPSWVEAARFPDVVDLVLVLGKKKARDLVNCLRQHATHLSDFCIAQSIVPVVRLEHSYARLTNRNYLLSLLIDAAARMVRDGYKKQLLEIAAKADPVPLLQRVLGPRSRPFLEATLRGTCGQFDDGRYIVSAIKPSPDSARSRARRAARDRRSRARSRRTSAAAAV